MNNAVLQERTRDWGEIIHTLMSYTTLLYSWCDAFGGNDFVSAVMKHRFFMYIIEINDNFGRLDS